MTILFLFFIRACASGVIQAVYVYTPEVYPTKMRAFALGFHTAAARLGAITTPYIAQVTQCHPKSIYPHLNIHGELQILFTGVGRITVHLNNVGGTPQHNLGVVLRLKDLCCCAQ